MYPFAGFVLNFNVATIGHRDSMDMEMCVILVISDDCEGGDLVLFEYGLVIPLGSGDVIAFPSHKVTHFNLHFKGKRSSIVFHSDKAGKEWSAGYNGWKDNIYFSNTQF